MAIPRLFAQLPAIALVNAAVAASSSILIARALGPNDQGVFISIVATAGVVALCVGSGTGITVRLESKGPPPHRAASNYFWFSLFAAFISGVVAAIYTLVALPNISTATIVLASFYFMTYTLTTQCTELVQALGKLLIAVSSPFIYSCALTFATVVLGLFEQASIITILLVACLGQVLQLCMLVIVTARHYRSLPGHPDLRGTFGLPRRSFHSLGSSLGMAILQRSLRVVLPFFVPLHVVGFVAAASVLAETQRVIPNALARIVFIEISAGRKWTPRALGATILGSVVSGATAAMLLLAGPWAVNLLFGDSYSSSNDYLPILIAMEFLMALLMMFSRAAIALGRVVLVARLLLVVSCGCIVGVVLLGTQMGALGLISIFAVGNVVALLACALWARAGTPEGNTK